MLRQTKTKHLGKRQQALLRILYTRTYGNSDLRLLWAAVDLRKLGFRGYGTAWVESIAEALQKRGFVELRYPSFCTERSYPTLYLTQHGQNWCELNPEASGG